MEKMLITKSLHTSWYQVLVTVIVLLVGVTVLITIIIGDLEDANIISRYKVYSNIFNELMINF